MVSRHSSIAPTGSGHEADRGDANTSGLNQATSILAVVAFGLAVMLYAAGFVLGWDPGAGARTDLYRYHLPTTYAFRTQPWSQVIHDYRSATTPLFHMLESFNPLLGHDTAFRATNVVLCFLLCLLYVYALNRRFAEVAGVRSLSLIIGAALLGSPYFESISYWPITDALPLLFLVLISLLLHDTEHNVVAPSTGHTSELGKICLTAICGAAAFYTRQSYLFLPLYAFIVLFYLRPKMRLVTLAVFAIVALPGVYLLYIWKGFTPPSFQIKHQGISGVIVVYPLTMIAFYAIPFIVEWFYQRRRLHQKIEVPRIQLMTVCVGLILFLIIFHRFTFAGHESGGGIASKIFQKCGRPGPVLFLMFAYAGLLILLYLLRICNWKTRVLLVCFAIPTLTMKVVFQRYYDPLIFMLFFLYFDKRFVRRFVSVRCGQLVLAFSLVLLCGCLFYHSSESPSFPLFGSQIPWVRERPTGIANLPYQ